MIASSAQIDAWLGTGAAGATAGPPSVMTGVSTDSRTLAPGALYVALRGERFDGHAFVDQAISRGAAGLVLERAPAQATGVPTWLVADTRAALARLAAAWRARFTIPLVAVLGSNGKTTVKEMLVAVLREAFGHDAVLGTRGNLNNDIGVPLTLFELRDTHRAAVLELGTNHPGEIDALARMAAPTVALVNNAQREHQEFLDGVEGSARENGAALERLPADGIAIWPGDDPCAPIWRAQAGGRQALCFGLRGRESAGVPQALDVHAAPESDPHDFEAVIGGKAVRLRLDAEGAHNVRNALAAATAAHALGVAAPAIAAGLAAFHPVAGRLRRRRAVGGAAVIDDTYNANPDSVLAAIEVLAACAPPRLLVLGDMGEVGPRGPEFHAEVGRRARQRGIERLFAFGPAGAATSQAFGDGGLHCADIGALVDRVRECATPAATVLVKGSRSMRMERVVHALCGDAAPSGGH